MIHVAPVEIPVAAKCWRLVRPDHSEVDYPFVPEFTVPEQFADIFLVLEFAGGEVEHHLDVPGAAGCTISAPGPFTVALEAT